MAGHAGGASATKKDWLCRKCVGADGNPFINFGKRTECRKCKAHKGQCHLRDVAIPPPRAWPYGGKPAKPPSGPNRATEAALAQALLRSRRLEDELKKRDEKDAQAAQGESPGDEGAGGEEAEDLDKFIELRTGWIKTLEAGAIPGTESQLENFKRELELARERKRDGQPLHQRLRRIERAITAKEASVAKLKDVVIPGAEKAMAELQEKLEKHRAKLDEEEKELRELIAKRDSERSAPAKALDEAKTPEELAAIAREGLTMVQGALQHALCAGESKPLCLQHVEVLAALLSGNAQVPEVPPQAEEESQPDEDAVMLDYEGVSFEAWDDHIQLLLATVSDVNDADGDAGGNDVGGADAKRRRKRDAAMEFHKSLTCKAKIAKPKKSTTTTATR